MILALALCLSAATVLAWLIFSLAIYALPVLAGLAAGSLAYGSGSGTPGAAVVALAVAALIYALGQVAIERSRSPSVRLSILAVYVVPAAAAGYGIVHGVAASLVPSPAWQFVFAIVGGVVVGASAWARMNAFAPPGEPGEARSMSVEQR